MVFVSTGWHAACSGSPPVLNDIFARKCGIIRGYTNLSPLSLLCGHHPNRTRDDKSIRFQWASDGGMLDSLWQVFTMLAKTELLRVPATQAVDATRPHCSMSPRGFLCTISRVPLGEGQL